MNTLAFLKFALIVIGGISLFLACLRMAFFILRPGGDPPITYLLLMSIASGVLASNLPD